MFNIQICVTYRIDLTHARMHARTYAHTVYNTKSGNAVPDHTRSLSSRNVGMLECWNDHHKWNWNSGNY